MDPNGRVRLPTEVSLQKLADEILPKKEAIRNRIEFTEDDLFIQVSCKTKRQAKHYLAGWTALIEFLPDD